MVQRSDGISEARARLRNRRTLLGLAGIFVVLTSWVCAQVRLEQQPQGHAQFEADCLEIPKHVVGSIESGTMPPGLFSVPMSTVLHNRDSVGLVCRVVQTWPRIRLQEVEIRIRHWNGENVVIAGLIAGDVVLDNHKATLKELAKVDMQALRQAFMSPIKYR